MSYNIRQSNRKALFFSLFFLQSGSILVLTLFLLSGCNNKKIQKQKGNILSEQKMVVILTDLYLAEALVDHQRSRVPELGKTAYLSRLEKEIFEKYGTDSSTYYKSKEFYTANPEEFEKIYLRVVDSLKKKGEKYRPAKPLGKPPVETDPNRTR